MSMSFKANRGLARADAAQAAMEFVVSEGLDQANIASRHRAPMACELLFRSAQTDC
jgi:hypothetical protein